MGTFFFLKGQPLTSATTGDHMPPPSQHRLRGDGGDEGDEGGSAKLCFPVHRTITISLKRSATELDKIFEHNAHSTESFESFREYFPQRANKACFHLFDQ